MKYAPQKSNAGWYGLIGIVVIFGFMIWGINYGLDNSDRILKIMLLVPTFLFLLYFIHVLVGAFNLHYKVEDDGLTIVWGFKKYKFKWDQITEITAIQGQSNFSPFMGATWPGYRAGSFSVGGLGAVHMVATHTSDGFICIKTTPKKFGLTPAYPGFLQVLLDQTGLTLKTIDMNQLTYEEKGDNIEHDRSVSMSHRLNQITLLLFAVYLGVFYPGSGAPRFIIILLVLAMAMYFFNWSNAQRIFQFSPQGANMILLVTLMMILVFFGLSFYGLTFM